MELNEKQVKTVQRALAAVLIGNSPIVVSRYLEDDTLAVLAVEGTDRVFCGTTAEGPFRRLVERARAELAKTGGGRG